MNKEEYLKKLAELLKDMPHDDKEDIISDYEEHFNIGIENGRDEEEISKALGDPKTVVKQIKVEYMIKKAENKPSASGMFEAALAAAGLGIFNLIFILGPGMVLLGIMAALFVTGVAVFFSGIATIMAPLLQPIFPQYINLPTSGGIWGTLVIMAQGAGLTVLGIALVTGMVYLAKWLYKMLIKYLKLNLKIINGRSGV
jgi:uncharacterized membrane protein